MSVDRFEHGDIEAGLVLELEPELAVSIACFLCLEVEEFVLPRNLIGDNILVLLYSEYHVVFDDHGGAEASTTHVVLVHTDHRVVAWEAELLVRAQHSSLMRWDVDDTGSQLALLLLHKLSPGSDIWQCLERVGPLAAQEPSRRILEVEGEQEGVLFVEVLGVDIRAEAHGFDQDLSEGAGVHLFGIVATDELVVALRIFPLEELLEGPEHE